MPGVFSMFRALFKALWSVWAFAVIWSGSWLTRKVTSTGLGLPHDKVSAAMLLIVMSEQTKQEREAARLGLPYRTRN